MLERVGTIRRLNRPIMDKCVSNGDVFEEVENTGASPRNIDQAMIHSLMTDPKLTCNPDFEDRLSP
jgi:hypothetical protein